MKQERPPLATSAAFLLLLLSRVGTPLYAQSHHNDYDEVDPWAGVKPPNPGPDSSAVAGFLSSLAVAEPVVCQFVVHSIGNNWGDWDGQYQPGSLKAEGVVERARQALSRRVTDPAALSHLAHALGDQRSCVRRAAARMLGQSEEAGAVQQLREALRREGARVREAAALGLADAEDPAAFHDLTRALGDREPAVVRMAAYALGELEDARAVKPLSALLRSGDAETRAAAATSLGEIEDIRATDRLTPLVRDSDPRVQIAGVEALGEIEDHRATGALTEALHDNVVEVRRAAAEALGELESLRAAGALAQAITDPDIVVQRLAAQSLGELDNLKRAPPQLVAALGSSDQELRIIAAMALGEIADSVAVPALSRTYAGAKPRLRYAVVRALAEIDDRRGDTVLALAAREKDAAIRHTAAEALKNRHEDNDDD